MNRQQQTNEEPSQDEITIPRSCISKNLEISTSKHELQKIWQLRTSEYNKHYSEFSCNDNDDYDVDALVLYSTNKKDQLISTGRIVFDSPKGLPADTIMKEELDKLRKLGINIGELSKLAISDEASGVLHAYIQTFYKVAAQQNIDSLIFICKDSSAVIYKRLVGAKILVENIQYSYGTDFTFSLLEWRIKESKYYQQQNKQLEAV